MKEKGKYLKLVALISVIVIIAVICTAVITTKMVSNMPDSVETSAVVSELEDRLYDNAEIISCSGGIIEYKWNGKNYRCRGELEKEYLGVADIEVKKHQIVRVKVKKQQVVNNEAMINVLLSNGDDIFYNSVWMSADNELYINGKGIKKKQLDISEYMKKNNKTNVVVTTKKGKIYFGSDKKHRKSQGYEGTFYVIKEDLKYVIVNEVELETYVRYVLPSEMPSYFSMEALKAQAICARTFAYSQMNNYNPRYAKYGADLEDSTASQVYNAGGTNERTDEAVRKTKGKVITCNGELIECYYFSTSAGKTEDMEVWGSETPSYIKKVKSKDEISPYFSWDAELDLKKVYDEEHGELKKITIDKKSKSGYILKLTAVFEKDTVVYTREDHIRKFLGQYMEQIKLQDGSVRTDISWVPSACFDITSKKGSTYKIKGSGYGHDIGLSQCGAQMMAEKGKKCDDILKYYYNNVKIVVK